MIALGIVAILASSCGGGELPPRLATSLQNRVSSIRDFAESGRPGWARGALQNLVELVTTEVDAGRIDEARGMEILAAAEAVADQLVLVPRSSPSEIPSPSPSEDGNGKPDKGKGEGYGDEGHGNDD